MHQLRRSVVLLMMSLLAFGVAGHVASAQSSKPKSCTILKPAQMAQVLNAEVSAATGSGTGGYACSFDIGPGLGAPGGGMVIVTYYTGNLATGIYQNAQKTGEKIPGTKAIWDPAAETAMIAKKGKAVAINVSYTNNTPPTDELRDEMAELATLASKKF